MIRKEVKKITVEYEDGTTETFEDGGMYHVARQEYLRGTTVPSEENAWISHGVHWREMHKLITQ